ncbi:MAG: GNAT family N-acetyltransferase [Halobacteriota archaeon]|nr:GNAT family N-acetyltransferase [Halobacteriota archaeon]
MIRRAEESDIERILSVLSCYNFKVLNPVDDSPIDDESEELITLYNGASELNLDKGFVAEYEGKIVGFSHYKRHEDGKAKTTLLTVMPKYRKHGFGKKLQIARMKDAYDNGYEILMTFTENPKASKWYVKHFGYQVIGTDVCYHRLHFIPLSNRIIWGVHYGIYGYDKVDVLECDLGEFFMNATSSF